MHDSGDTTRIGMREKNNKEEKQYSDPPFLDTPDMKPPSNLATSYFAQK